MISEYFTLLASLEYNMQEMYRVHKLANDLVDTTVTVKMILCSIYILKNKREKAFSVF